MRDGPIIPNTLALRNLSETMAMETADRMSWMTVGLPAKPCAKRRGRDQASISLPRHLASLIFVLIFCVGCTSWREYRCNGFKVGPNYKRPDARNCGTVDRRRQPEHQQCRTKRCRMVEHAERSDSQHVGLHCISPEPHFACRWHADTRSPRPARHCRWQPLPADAGSNRQLYSQ